MRAGTSELAAAAPTLEALMQLLVARAQLLLSLRSAASSLQVQPLAPSTHNCAPRSCS